jgi:hypothetical protein
MSESLINVANESWRDEIKRYNYRLDVLTNLVDVISKLDLNVGYLWKKIEIDFDLYNSQSILPKSLNLQGSMVALQLLIYAQTNSRIVINVIKNIIKFWHSGLRLGMEGNGIAADHKVFNLMAVEPRQEFFEVLIH